MLYQAGFKNRAWPLSQRYRRTEAYLKYVGVRQSAKATKPYF